MNQHGMIARLLAELGYVASDAASSGFAQPHPITVGRPTTIPAKERGETEILKVPGFPVHGRVWCIGVSVGNKPIASPAAAPLGGIVALPVPRWLSLKLEWTLGNCTLGAELDLVAGAHAFPVLCDSVRVIAVNNPPDPLPPEAVDIELLATVGHQGSRPTAIPRKTVLLLDVPKTGSSVAAIPIRATELTIGSLDQAALPVPLNMTIQFFDWLGNLAGSTYLSSTSTPRPIDIPQGASIVKVTNTTPTNADVQLVFRIAL
jgi:hypothetical protein